MKQIKTEILFGIHPILEALKAQRRIFHEVFIIKDKSSKRTANIAEIAGSRNIPVSFIHPTQIRTMTGTDNHQGVAARVSVYPVVSLSEIISDQSENNRFPFYLLIDNVVDPHNLGALIRTALCAEITGVMIPKDRSAEPSPTVSKASAGALEHIRLARIVNMATTIKDLKKDNIWIIGLDKDGDRSIYENDFNTKIALVVGGEENGIRPLVKQQCDFLSYIPQAGRISSLNASVAGAIAMYESYRQRNV